MSFLDELTSDEKKAIEELQQRMNKELPSDMLEDKSHFLYRFLKARNFDVEKAEIMLRNHFNWRKSFQVDRILEDFKPKEFFLKYVIPGHIGLDKEGHMVKYMAMGKMDAGAILKCTKLNDYMRHWIWYTECCGASIFKQQMDMNCKELRGNPTTIIIDLDKLTFMNTTSRQSAEIMLRLLGFLCDNYPEFLKTAYIINAPSYYVVIFSLLKKLMSSALVKKIKVFSHNGWKENLLEVIDADVLPAFLGGNRTDPDGNPLCTTVVIHPEEISEMYYLQSEERYFKDQAKVEKILIPHLGKKEIIVDVAEKGSLIQWEFLVMRKDIGFGLHFELPEGDEAEEILPVQRYDTMDGTEVGCYRTRTSGKYIVTFHNSYSWISSKEVEYCITVIKPGL